MRRKYFWPAVVLAVVLVAGSLSAAWGLGVLPIEPSTQRGGEPEAIATAELSDAGPGSLVSAVTMPEFAHSDYGKNMQSARVVYRSTSGDSGAPTVVSGSVFIPLGAAPDGGWPVIAFAHGTTGINEPCAPSRSPTLLGMGGAIDAFIKNGYAVAFADYEGLGSPGLHPYSDSRTAGLNLIDSVRALRHTFDNVSARWAAVGGSQGGGAVWAADEQADAYGPDLDLVGAVAYVPSADLVGLVDKAQTGTLTDDQELVFQWIVESLARRHPDLDRNDFRRGAAAKYWDVLSACSGPMVRDRKAAAEALQGADLAPATPAAADKLRELLRAWALPQRPLSAPLSVVYHGRDTFIDADWTTAAIARACALGGAVSWQLDPAKGHGGVDVTNQLTWIAERFAGKPVSNECPSQS